MKRLALFMVGVFIGTCVFVATAHATTESRFAHYRDRTTGNVLIVKRTCIAGEDSMMHPRTLSYSDHGGRVVLGCYHHGY